MYILGKTTCGHDITITYICVGTSACQQATVTDDYTIKLVATINTSHSQVIYKIFPKPGVYVAAGAAMAAPLLAHFKSFGL